jgi:SAM-dependent methyltransferase
MTNEADPSLMTASAEAASEAEAVRRHVRLDYARVAVADDQGNGCGVASSCCGTSDDAQINQLISIRLGYSQAEREAVPAGADLGLGCGNPRAIASLRQGETVLDLGSGAGFDCFLAAAEVGESGRVIGVDMTPEMVDKARRNAKKGGYTTVEFRLGEIERLPVTDDSIDCIISNCVINLSPDKPAVFRESFRVLKPGGRLAISDVVATAELPHTLTEDAHLHSACIAGAAQIDTLHAILDENGFTDIRIEPKDASRAFIRDWAPGRGVEDYVVSATIEAVKPAG